MHPPRFVLSLCCLALATASALAADLKLAPLFCDHAVLQQGKPVPVWGWGNAGDKVEVAFNGQTVATVIDPAGRWQASLPALQASAEPKEVTVTAEGKTLTIRDVVVGEVWLCSGQSNMEWRVDQALNAEKEMADAHYPLIRQFRVPKVYKEEPIVEFQSSWVAASPKTVGMFSAVAYFFARDLQRDIHVPIGLINASFGGKMIEVFMSPEALASDPAFAVVFKRWEAEQKTLPVRMAAWEKSNASPGASADAPPADGESPARAKGMSPHLMVEQHRPGCLFNGMLNPLLPCALRGMIWYQGEHNIARAGEYRSLFPSFIKDMRQKFQQGDFPFYYVQLANFEATLDKTREGYAQLREAQLQTLSLPNTGMTVTVDIGTPENVHPKNKQDVGARLARLARAKTYNLGGVYSGPIFKSAVREGSSLRLMFDYAEGGLVAPKEPVASFELAGPDGKFQAATAEIEADTLVVKSDAVKDPTAVRYAWANAPVASLFNQEGLPASPFRHTLLLHSTRP